MSTQGRRFFVGAAALSLLPFLGLTSCGGGTDSPARAGGGAFVVLDTYPQNNGRIFLNESVRITFSNPIDLATANFNSVAFLVRDSNGNPLSESVVGTFRHGKNDEGQTDTRILEFVPKLPENDEFTDGGLRPGRQYILSLVNASNPAAPTVRDSDGREISVNTTIRGMAFTTASGSTPTELFLDYQVGGPQVASVDVTPRFGGLVSLNDLGGVPVEFSVSFNQTLNPTSSNLPVRQSVAPINGNARRKGKIFLEYDDPELGDNQWIRAEVELPVNSLVNSVVTLRPDGVLPNDAEIRVIVENDLEDISGESNIRNPNFQRVVGSFRTEKRHALQFDAIVFDFENSELSDPEAAFRDPVADISNGELRASFDFEGIETPLNFEPNSATNVLSTDFTQLVPSNGLPFDVAGGIFRINDVHIKEGVTVQGVGSNPMVWLASGDFRVDGTLHVNGGPGAQVDTLNGANFPTAGGQGVCTGGNGGVGSPLTSNTSVKGEDGYGPFQRPGLGGKGGDSSCGSQSNSFFGAGGWRWKPRRSRRVDLDFVATYDADTSASGRGGTGQATSGAIPGGDPMESIFTDDNDDNNFWGRTLDASGQVLIGELQSPRGGGGGGGGGDRSPDPSCSTGNNFFNDEKGGGGGGGAGVLIIKALGTVTVGPNGTISANGGFGGGGEDAGGCRQGGGGGGGAGGMVIIEASKIVLYEQAGLWSGKDAKFAISADGGIGSNTSWQTTARLRKYQQADGKINRGGFGGMGVVQLMTPAGNDQDNTGNVQDDNIVVLDANDVPQPKTPRLFKGDIRPDPILLPATFGRNSSWISRYVSLGSSVRRVVSSADGVRATTAVPVHDATDKYYGPDYYFAGLIQSGNSAGYLRTDDANGRFDFEALKFGGLDRFAIASREENATSYRGLTVHRVTLGNSPLPTDSSLTNYSLRLYNVSGATTGDHRILSHSGNEVLVDARDGLLASDATSVGIVPKFFEVVTDGNEGLGQSYLAVVNGRDLYYPIANVQIGFAFHKDPANPNIQNGKDLNRFPQDVSDFLYDLESDGPNSLREELRKLHYPFAKMKVRFNLNYDFASPDTSPGPNPVNSLSQRPALRFVRLGYAR